MQRSRDLLAIGILESVISLKLQGEQCPPRGMGYLGILIECRRKKTMIAFLVPMGEGKDVSCRKYFAVKQQKQCRLCPPFILSLIRHKGNSCIRQVWILEAFRSILEKDVAAFGLDMGGMSLETQISI